MREPLVAGGRDDEMSAIWGGRYWLLAIPPRAGANTLAAAVLRGIVGEDDRNLTEGMIPTEIYKSKEFRRFGAISAAVRGAATLRRVNAGLSVNRTKLSSEHEVLS